MGTTELLSRLNPTSLQCEWDLFENPLLWLYIIVNWLYHSSRTASHQWNCGCCLRLVRSDRHSSHRGETSSELRYDLRSRHRGRYDWGQMIWARWLISVRLDSPGLHRHCLDRGYDMEIGQEARCCRPEVWNIFIRHGTINWQNGARREMQLFLLGFIVIEICEIFTVGGFPLNDAARKVGFLQDRPGASADRSI